jgi:hypothetical protein
LDDSLAEFDRQENLLSDALTAADQTIGPHGRPMTVSERIDDMPARHGDDSPMLGPTLNAALISLALLGEWRLGWKSAGIDSAAHRML